MKSKDCSGAAQNRLRTARYKRLAKRLHEKQEVAKRAEREAKEEAKLRAEIKREEMKADEVGRPRAGFGHPGDDAQIAPRRPGPGVRE